MEGLPEPVVTDKLTLLQLPGSASRDTLITVFAHSGAGTLSWRASGNLHLLGLVSTSANGTLYVVGMTTIAQPGVYIGIRQISPSSSFKMQPMNIAVIGGETIYYVDTVAATTQVVFAYD